MISGHFHTPTLGQAGAGLENFLWIVLILAASFMVAEVMVVS